MRVERGTVGPMNYRTTSLAALLFVSAVACSKKEPEAAPAEKAAATEPATATPGTPADKAAPSNEPQSRCEIKVTGDLQVDVLGQKARSDRRPDMDAPMAATDHWLTDEELRSGLTSMIKVADGKKTSEADIAAEVDKLMKTKDPRFMVFMLSCAGKNGSVSINPGKEAKYANVPYGPKAYRLVDWKDSTPDDMTASTVHFKSGADNVYFDISEPGTFELKTFDENGVTGTFAFKAASRDGKKIEVAGSFDVACLGAKCKK
jgi:hypothetical protein